MLSLKLRHLSDWGKTLRVITSISANGVGTFRLARKAIREKQAVQRTSELMSLLGMLRAFRPGLIMEIGTHKGGTLYCWPYVATEDATIISLDLPNGPFGGGYAEQDAAKFQTFLKDKQSLICLRKDSHLRETFDTVVRVLGGKKIDFLFIDGDHTYDGVKADFEDYSPLVRQGGLIAFHDIKPNPNMPECQVHVFWQEIKQAFKHYEFIDQSRTVQYGMGIGVLVNVYE